MNQLLRLCLLGSPRVLLDDQPLTSFVHNKAQALLFYLAATGQTHSRAAVATLLWSEMNEAQAHNNLRTVLPELRRLVGNYLVIERQTVAFQRTSHYWLDVEALRRDLEPSQSPLDLAARQAAVDLYQGEFLSGFYVRDAPAFEAWVLEQREHLHALVVTALTALIQEYTQGDDHASALAASHRLLVLEPWSEPVQRQQMLLLAQTGERAAALAQYEACRRMLAAEFGVAPLAETTALYEQIKAGSIAVVRRERAQGQLPSKRALLIRQVEKVITPQNEQTDSAFETTEEAQSVKPWPRLPVTGHNLPPRTKLYGRQLELARLQKWIGEEGCRLVGIIGMGGQGKTTLAATLVRDLAEATPQTALGGQFQRIIWQSLLNAPPLAEVMQSWFYLLSDQTVTSLPTSLDQQFSQLLDYLQRQRCLLVLDNLDSILQGEGGGGAYRLGYAAYAQLIRHFLVGEHRSCLLLTSREWPQDLTGIEEDTPTVRFLALAGLPVDAGGQMLVARGVGGDATQLATLVQHYSGNPLALKLVTETVQSLFAGEIAAFLQADALIFADIRAVLDQQFARLTLLERELMGWLAIVREPITYATLRSLLAHPPAPRALLEAVRSLQRRSLLETYPEGFGLQNVVLEYTTDLLIENFVRELLDDPMPGGEIGWWGNRGELIHPPTALLPYAAFHLNRYALILAQAKDYVRASQTRLLLQPVSQRLLVHWGERDAAQQLQGWLALLRQYAHLRTAPVPGYAAANLLHLLLQLGVNPRGYDFSQLSVWQAYLRGVALPQVNFTQADLAGAVFTEPLGRIFTVAFSPDGQYLAAGTREGAIHLWRTADQQLIQVIQAHNHSVIDLSFMPHPMRDAGMPLLLASAGGDQAVGLWQVTEDSQSRWHGQVLQGHQQRVIGVAFSAAHSGRPQHLLSFDLAGGVRMWEIATGEAFQYNISPPPEARAVAFSRGQQLLASGSSDGQVRLWSVLASDGETEPGRFRITTPSLTLTGHTARLTSVVFSPNDQILASGARDGRICLWSLPHGQLHQVLEPGFGMVMALAFSPDSKTLASCHWDRTVRVWDLDTGQLRHTLVGHTHVLNALAFHPNGQILASTGSDQTVRLWEVQTGQALATLRGHYYALNAMVLSPDGRLLAGVGYDQVIHLWSWSGDTATMAHRALRGHTGMLHTVAFSPDGLILASAGRDAAIYLWDVDSGQLQRTLHGHTPDIYRVWFHPDGRLLASGGADGTVRLWHLHDLAHTQTCDILQTGSEFIYALAFSPDGHLLASAGAGQTIRLWDMTQAHFPELVAARKVVQEEGEHEILALIFSPDSAKLAASSSHLIHIWDLHSGELQAILRHHTAWVMAIAFSPDGAFLASASEDRTVCLWNLARGTLQHVLTGHTEGVSSVVFSADGATLLSASADGTIKFWDSQTGECLDTLRVEDPYAGMRITGMTGVTPAQKAALKALGALEE